MTFGILEAGILLIIAGIAYWSIKSFLISQSSHSAGSILPNAVKADLELLEHKTRNINYFHFVTGTIRNNTNKTYEHVEVQVSIYNNDVLMGTTAAKGSNLEPGETWSFEAPVLEQGAYQYKFTSITGY